MLEKIKESKITHNGNYIGEVEVKDTETNELFYVVAQLGNLFYKTFKSSWIEYVKNQETVKEPEMVEGENCLWFWFLDAEHKTRFNDFYYDALGLASSIRDNCTIKRKYAHMKKPLNNIEYKIINKRDSSVMACGPMGNIYEIEFELTSDKSHVFVCAEDMYPEMMILKQSMMDSNNNEDEIFEERLDFISDFSKAKKSKYYDLYLEMQKFIDNYEQ